jgi:hypothetical protein
MPSDSDVLHHVYCSTVERGRPPLAAEVAAALGGTRDGALAAFAALRARRLLFLGRDTGEIVMAPPFSAVPTAFLVHAGGRRYFANCVWDAYGVAAALHADARIEASCACCGEPMALAIDGGAPGESLGAGVAHFAVPAAHWWDDLTYT